MIINKTTKRLLSASMLQITFDYADGHRWIYFQEEGNDRESMYEKLNRHKFSPETKVYGNIIDCLNYVDYLLKQMGEKTLEEKFDDYNDWGFDGEFDTKTDDWENSGSDTEESFEKKTTKY